MKNEKMANRKLGKVGNLGNLGEIIPSFLISEFSILPYSQNRKLGFEILAEKFPRLLRFPRFPSFRPGPRIGVFQLTMFKSLPSCYFKPTLNLYNFTSFLSARNLFVILP